MNLSGTSKNPSLLDKNMAQALIISSQHSVLLGHRHSQPSGMCSRVTWTEPCKHQVPETLDSWLIPRDQGGRESGPALCGRSYAVPSEKGCRNTPRACVWAPAKDLSYSTTAKQYYTQRQQSEFQVRKEPSLSPFSGNFPLGAGEIDKEETSPFFSA